MSNATLSLQFDSTTITRELTQSQFDDICKIIGIKFVEEDLGILSAPIDSFFPTAIRNPLNKYFRNHIHSTTHSESMTFGYLTAMTEKKLKTQVRCVGVGRIKEIKE